MYVRDAKNRDEAWLLDRLEEMEVDETAFRSRDYVLAVDETDDDRVGFGRLRVHKTDDGEVRELTSLGVLPAWREQGVGAHVVERLVEYAADAGDDVVYALTDRPAYFAQFGFETIAASDLPDQLGDRLADKREDVAPDAVPMSLVVDEFAMPQRLRDRFKRASARDGDAEPVETAEDFGIDPDEASYKYDTT